LQSWLGRQRGSGQPSEHQLNHRDVDHGLTGGGEIFVVLTQSPISSQPTESSFHHPTSRQHFKSCDIVAPPYNFQSPTGQAVKPSDQLSSIATIRPNQLESGKAIFDSVKQQLGPVSVLDVRRMNHHRKHQSHRVYEKMPLATVDFLACIVSARPPFSVVFTDWLSTIPALGSSCRPARCLTSRRRTS